MKKYSNLSEEILSEAMDVEVDGNRMTVSAQNKIIEKATNQ